jgi:hypothetical protein
MLSMRPLYEEMRVANPANGELEQAVRDATASDVIASAAIFLAMPGSTTLELAAAEGIGGPALDGLIAAVRDPGHPVARALNDSGPTFDVAPMNPGGPRLRSHLPLATQRDGRRMAVGVLAVAHDAPLDSAERQRLIDLADAAAAAVRQ